MLKGPLFCNMGFIALQFGLYCNAKEALLQCKKASFIV